ncbi:MAG: hypothetical protein MI743_01945 [Sneathiellales bacterium]|nr:hypothetical protein [Sneathiellales bacterium]
MGFYTDRTQSLMQYYKEKYGVEALKKLEEDAGFCEAKNDLQRRNRLLRVRDELLLEGMSIR